MPLNFSCSQSCVLHRASSSEFIIPFRKFSKSLSQSFLPGMRFKMRFESEDASERRYTGLITGIGDMDHLRWPGSKWRCLMVRWDDVEVTRNNRVSPWEIELTGSVSGANSMVPPGSKRTRIGIPTTKLDFPLSADGIGVSDFGESLRFQKVLQGQEIMGFTPPYGDSSRCFVAQRRHPPELPECSSGSYECTGFGEPFRFNKVLQGQETFPTLPYGRARPAYQVYENSRSHIIDVVRVPSSGTGWAPPMKSHPVTPMAQGSSPSSVLTSQHPKPSGPSFSETYFGNLTSFSLRATREQPINSLGGNEVGPSHLPEATQVSSACKSSCRLFGFSLTEGSRGSSKEQNPTVSFMPHGESHLHQKVAGGRDIYGVRDRLLDIAL